MREGARTTTAAVAWVDPLKRGPGPARARTPAPRLMTAAMVALLALLALAEARAGAAERAGRMAGDAVWGPRETVTGPVTIPTGASLTVLPGAEIRFRPGASLRVEGHLDASGTPAQPILFTSETDGPPGSWGGITLAGAGAGSRMRHCQVFHAAAVIVAAGTPVLEDCEIARGSRGLIVHGKETAPSIRRLLFRDLAEGGAMFQIGAAGSIEDCRFADCGAFGVAVTQGASTLVRRNTVERCASGLEVSNTEPRLRENTVRDCARGIALASVGGGHPISWNTLVGNKIGILVHQFSQPEISANTVADNEEGIVCFQGARPVIRGNEIRGNARGLSCVQMSSPEVRANRFVRNKAAIHLTLSSYPSIRGNDFVDNDRDVELDNMSLDWERRVKVKPARGRQQQALAQAVRRPGSASPGQGDGFTYEGGTVDARENWWGERTTKQMEDLGPDANLTTIVDGHDVPTRTYEGYEGEFVQDRVTYAPWAKAPVAVVDVTPPSEGGPVRQ